MRSPRKNAMIYMMLSLMATKHVSNAFRTAVATTSCRPYSTTRIAAKKMKSKHQSRTGDFWEAKMEDDIWRPDINDVERISWGKAAKKKGTGSRGVPHRLNLNERFLFDNVRKKGFLEIDGSGWRSQRRDAPLLNTYRSLCDARGQVSIVLHKGNTGIDELVVDISPLRNPIMFQQIAETCLQQHEGGEIVFQGSLAMADDTTNSHSTNPNEDLTMTLSIVDDGLNEKSSWFTRPIYQLPPYCISWELERNDAKALGKKMAILFDTIEENVAPSKKPIGIKPGKSRQHGGYGIG